MPFLKGRGILESRCRNLENLSKKNGLRNSVYTPAKDRYVGEWKDNIKKGNFARTQSAFPLKYVRISSI